jgi:glycosyltransferase involved in cell wall biosynthesis
MALVTFGVPVYNGAGQIEECLDCIVNQTLRDIEIVVSDNASTDATGDIVQRYSVRDSRIRYIRQPTNIGLMKNFDAVVHAAQSPYFILRCHDDLSSPNYAEALYAALQANPRAKLAAPNIETLKRGRERALVRAVPRIDHASRLVNVSALLFGSHAGWYCGLWETQAFREVFDRVWARYNSPWGPDHLTMYPFLIAGQVALVPDATFIQRITPKVGDAKYAIPDVELMRKLRATFIEMCAEFRREQGVTGAEERALAVMTWLYTGKRVYRARKIWRHTLLGR